jgi:hypothetical protein
MNALKMRVFMLITALIFLLSNITVFAWPEMTGGKIIGEDADYQITIPEEIRNWISVDKAYFDEDPSLIEGITFFCKSFSKKYFPEVLMRLYVFEKANWGGLAENNLEVVLVSRDYVFAAEIYYDNGFLEAQDKLYYERCRQFLGKADAIKNLIKLSPYQQNLFDSTVFINGEPLDEKAVIIDDVYYVPLRAVFVEMAFKVVWNGQRNRIEITKNDYRDAFIVSAGKCLGNGFKILIINDRAYISTVYFLRYLEQNVEIDAANNIYIMA